MNKSQIKTALDYLIKTGRSQGYLTFQEINESLQGKILDQKKINSIILILKELDIIISLDIPKTIRGEPSRFVSKEFAIQNNLKRFFTGKPCLNGHINERLSRNGECIECRRLQKKRRYDRKK